jgi:hypothetical protein
MHDVELHRACMNLGWPLLLGSALLGWGCSDPVYNMEADAETPAADAGMLVQDDAGMLMRDAGMPVRDAGMVAPSAAELLVGRYALRIRYHARQPAPGLFKQSEEAVLLADVEQTGGGLQLRTQLCEQHSVSPSTIGADVRARISFPELVPVRTWALTLEVDGTFHAEGPALEIGYGPAPAACAPGASIASGAAWLSGASCTCPGAEALPASSADCRVIDSDLDRNPGMTVRFSGLVERTDFVCRRDASQLVKGSISSDKSHTAQYDTQIENQVLVCEGAGCGSSDFIDCAPAQNRVQFSPLDARASSGFPYTCADVLREVEAGKHFTPDPLTFPSGC